MRSSISWKTKPVPSFKKKKNVSQSGQEGFMHRYYCVLDWHILMLLLGRKKMNNFENNQPQLCAFSRPVANEKEKEKVDLHLSSPTLSIMFCFFLIILITVLNKKIKPSAARNRQNSFQFTCLGTFFFQNFCAAQYDDRRLEKKRGQVDKNGRV